MHDELKPLGIIAGILAAGALLAALFTPAGSTAWLSLALALFLYAFLPGYTLLLHLDMDAIERSIFAFPVGTMSTAIALYALNLFGIALTRLVVLAVIIVITAASLFLLHRRKKQQPSTSLAQ